MNWKNDIQKKQSAANDFYKEISRLEKEIKSLGKLDPLEYISEQIENEYKFPCRVRPCGYKNRRIILFKKSATKKQIQYNREEMILGELLIGGTGLDIYIDYDRNRPVALPDTLNGIFEILIDKR